MQKIPQFDWGDDDETDNEFLQRNKFFANKLTTELA